MLENQFFCPWLQTIAEQIHTSTLNSSVWSFVLLFYCVERCKTMSAFLPNGKNFIRKCLHSKYVQVFFTAINTVIHGFLLPAHLWLYLTYVIVLGYIVLRKLFIVVQTCVVMRPVLYIAGVLYKSVSYSCKHEQGGCVSWVLLVVDVCFKFL